MAPNQLKKFIALRAISRDQMQELQDLANRASREEAVYEVLHCEFKVRYRFIQRIYDEFYQHHNNLVVHLTTIAAEEAEVAQHSQVRVDFDNIYFDVHAKYNKLFNQPNPLQRQNSANSEASSNNAIRDHIKLPRMELPKFRGDWKAWKTYIDIFNSAVHHNSSLSNIDKFSYLLSTLSDEPLSIVNRTPMADANYVIAYDSLCKRYDNKRLLATAYWQQIDKSPQLHDDYKPAQLRNLLNIFEENLAALKNLAFPVDSWNFILLNLLLKRLPPSVVSRFELEQRSPLEVPDFESLKIFSNRICQAADQTAQNTAKFSDKPQKFSSPTKPKLSATLLVKAESNRCTLCNGDHGIYKCPTFLAGSPQTRFSLAKDRRWCLNCLGSKHSVRNCNSKSTCRECNQKHHSLLHFGPLGVSALPAKQEVEISASSPDIASTSHKSEQQAVQSLTNVIPTKTTVLLSTALVGIQDKFGNFQTVRALLDSGSQASFITVGCAKRLGLPSTPVSLDIQGLGAMNASASRQISCVIKSVHDDNSTWMINAVVLPKICNNMPAASFSPSRWASLANLTLADGYFNISQRIDVLLGADIFPLLLETSRIEGNSNEPTALSTKLGWILMGKFELSPASHAQINAFCTSVSVPPLESLIKRFWEIEEPPAAPTFSEEDNRAEEIFSQQHYRNVSGRFVVPLPFRSENCLFSGSYEKALHRLHALERRLEQNPSIRAQYIAFMQEYLLNAHMEPSLPVRSHQEDGYFIPHHCIGGFANSAAKFRVVFDASCKAKNNLSLNDALLVGPKLQKDICTVLTRVRCHPIIFATDIRQMYRQILILPEQRRYQKILWRFSSSDPVQVFVLNTVTYGVSSSPYLALRTIRELAKAGEERFPKAARVLHSDIYMDDIITGCGSLDEALRLRDELVQLLEGGGFELRKWASNNDKLLADLPSTHRQSQSLTFSAEPEPFVKILGLQWQPQSDCFSYKHESLDKPCSKRNLLSQLARIFDPLGFLAPLTFYAKCLIQHLWTLGLGWDEVPPQEVIARWLEYGAELPMLSSMKVPRRLTLDNFVSCELHGFCDSSEKGYAAVVYLRSADAVGNIGVQFVIAKSKVAPLKRVSLPRLELCGALLLANLINYTVTTLKDLVHCDRVVAWSDSTVALSWIKSSPHRWKTFVSNRVAQIQSVLSPDQWHHIRSLENPADCASRGLGPQQLLSHPLWWAGPSWLGENSAPNPPEVVVDHIPDDALQEQRPVALIAQIEPDSLDLVLNNVSSLRKILKIVAYCRRFISNIRSKVKVTDALSELELHQALMILAKHTQSQSFAEEISQISRKKVPKALRKLSPFIDDEGLLRVGGRLKNASLPANAKHPILLPKNHRLTVLLIEDLHLRHFHPGGQTLHLLILQNFWIIGARRAISQVVSKCLRCWRSNPPTVQPSMGDLPQIRVSQLKPFSCVGVDFGGPFFITLGKTRGSKSQKAYICLFVCFATKAIHLELASDLSTDAFLAALRRFIARRGRCSQIFSDCGTNFVGASRELVRCMKDASEAELLKWSFIPPAAPHFGGLWEAGIKATKTHLYRVIGSQILTYEELNTLLVQIESLLNSRPLCPISADPNDLSALTPGHFLTLEPLSAPPEPDLSHLKINRLSRWQLLQRLHQDFWNRWHQEYLHTLYQRGKWTSSRENIKPGALVIVKNELTPPLKWQLARVIDIHPGADGIVRVVTLHTASGTMKRPVVKVCPLPGLPGEI